MQNAVLQLLRSKIGSNFDINNDTLVKENLARIEVFFKEFKYEDILESPGYPVSSFVFVTCNRQYFYLRFSAYN